MDFSDENLPKQWAKKRKRTTIAFIIQSILMGWEYGIFIVNLWLYITEMVDTEHPRISYCIIAVAYLLSATISSVFISWLADKTREIQKTILFTNSMFIVGNIIYMIPFSPFLLLSGRIIAGIGQPGRSVMAGELARSYPADQMFSVFSVLGAAYGLGFMLAPGLNVVFSATDLTWGGKLHVTYANISGFYMGILFLFAQMMHVCMTSNLSKEYDLKREQETDVGTDIPSCESSVGQNDQLLQKQEMDEKKGKEEAKKGNTTEFERTEEHKNEENDVEKYEEEEGRSLLPKSTHKHTLSSLLKQLLSNADTLLLLSLQCMESYVVLSMDLCLPMLIVTKLHWSHAAYNGIIVATSIFTLIPSIYLIFQRIADETMFYIALPSILAYALMQLIQMTWQQDLSSREMNIFLAVVYCFMFTDLVLIREVFVGSFLGRMVMSRYQSSVNSIRLAMSRIGALVAMVSAPFALKNIEIVGTVVIGVILVFGILLLSRRKTMKSPKIIIF